MICSMMTISRCSKRYHTSSCRCSSLNSKTRVTCARWRCATLGCRSRQSRRCAAPVHRGTRGARVQPRHGGHVQGARAGQHVGPAARHQLQREGQQRSSRTNMSSISIFGRFLTPNTLRTTYSAFKRAQSTSTIMSFKLNQYKPAANDTSSVIRPARSTPREYTYVSAHCRILRVEAQVRVRTRRY